MSNSNHLHKYNILWCARACTKLRLCQTDTISLSLSLSSLVNIYFWGFRRRMQTQPAIAECCHCHIYCAESFLGRVLSARWLQICRCEKEKCETQMKNRTRPSYIVIRCNHKIRIIYLHLFNHLQQFDLKTQWTKALLNEWKRVLLSSRWDDMRCSRLSCSKCFARNDDDDDIFSLSTFSGRVQL